MRSFGIRELKQNASEVVAIVRRGEVVTITDRGVPVAQMAPIVKVGFDALVAAGRVRFPTHPLDDVLDDPLVDVEGSSGSQILREMRDEQRF